MSVTEGKSLTSGEVHVHKYVSLQSCGLPKAPGLLKKLFSFHLEWKCCSKCNDKKITNPEKLSETCFANRNM